MKLGSNVVQEDVFTRQQARDETAKFIRGFVRERIHIYRYVLYTIYLLYRVIL